jgi:hypothetical protein
VINLNHGSGSLTGEATVDVSVSDIVNRYITEALLRRRLEKLATEDRNYLGMSEIGDKCARRVYYYATGVQRQELTGEKLRVFEMGHQFEYMVYEWLTAAGFIIKIRNKQGQQFEFSTAGGRIKGHIDGAIAGGPPVQGLVYPALWENKALKAKYWNAIVKHGLDKAEPKYHAQVQQYMGYGGLTNTLFTTINKDTAEIYHCIIPYSLANAQKLSDRGVAILKSIDMKVAPPRISANMDFFICKQCEFRDHCWSSAT